MKRDLNALQITICILIAIGCIVFCYALLTSGEVEQIYAAVGLVFICICACTSILLSGKSAQDTSPPEQSDTPSTASQPVSSNDVRRRNLAARMGITVGIIIFGIGAGFLWVVASLYGSEAMLYSGWSFIAFAMLLGIILTWAAPP